jgi:ribulose bisphosphate carboxylase small subunit
MKQKILGLDISTSITGMTIIEQGEIIEASYWDTRNKRKFPSLYEKADLLQQDLWRIKARHNIAEIYIEQSLQSFRSGFSSAKTLSTLARFNGIISWNCYKVFGIKPSMVAASTARKLADVGIKRGDNAKQKVLEFILDKYPQITIEYTKHGNPKPGMLDMCDSIIIALAGEKIAREVKTT